MEEPTARQKLVFEFIRDFIRHHDRSPTVREIQVGMDMKSTHGVWRHLIALKKKGLIEKDKNKARGIRLNSGNVELAGSIPIIVRVADGTPVTAPENIEGYLSIGALFGDPMNLFSIRMKGDSMIGAEIYDGDLVIVQKMQKVDDGTIGVAIVEGKLIVRRISSKGNYIRLESENKDHKTFLYDPAKHDVSVAGKVVGAVRKIQEEKSNAKS
jgi:repressor LexA